MLFLLPVAAALLRGLALPGWWLPAEAALFAVPLRILYWERRLAVEAAGGSRRLTLLGDWLGGFLHVVIYFRFLHEVFPGGNFAVAPILGLWWVAEGALYRGLRRWTVPALAGAAALVAVEWFRFHGPMGGVPWGSLALGLADRPVALHWASALGESGLVVLVALAGAFVWSLFARQTWWELLAAPALVGVAVLFATPPPEPVDAISSLAVQGNLSIDEKHGEQLRRRSYRAREVYLTQARVTWQGLAEVPEVELVLWSETMYPFPLTPDPGEPGGAGFVRRPWPTYTEQIEVETLRAFNAARIQELIGGPGSGRTFITGGHFYLGVDEQPEWQPGQPRQPETWSPRTSELVAFDDHGRLGDHFSKARLVPMGERLPFDGNFPGGDWLALQQLRTTRLFPRFADSGRVGPLDAAGHRFGGAVCWENVFEGPFRKQADDGAEAFLILSNENWYRLSEEMDQMVASTRLRAAETGRPLLRVANTGVTALFDGRGRILESLPRGEPGWMAVRLPLIDGSWRTPYQRFGWFLQPTLAWAALALAAAGWLRGRRRRTQVPEETGGSPPPAA